MAEIHLTHQRLHELTSPLDHFVTGLTPGEVLTATGASSFDWVAPSGGGGGGGGGTSGVLCFPALIDNGNTN
jgi:hypothetical protein